MLIILNRRSLWLQGFCVLNVIWRFLLRFVGCSCISFGQCCWFQHLLTQTSPCMEPFRNDGMSGGLQRHQQRVGPTLGCCWGIPLGSLNGTVFLEGCRETSAATCRVKCWGRTPPPFFLNSCMKFGLVSLGKNRINCSAFGGLCLVAFVILGPFGQGRKTKSTEEGNSEKTSPWN